MTSKEPISPVRIPNPGRNRLQRLVFEFLRPAIDSGLGLKRLNKIYSERVLATDESLPVGERFLRGFNAGYLTSDEELARIPKEGPLIVVANHAFGGLDAMVLDDLVAKVRPDVRFIANSILAAVPAIGDRIFPVDPFGGRDAARRNAGSIRRAKEWVENGGSLGVFPAGEVAHSEWGRLSVTDPPWNPIIGRLIRSTGASVIPVFFEGRNSWLFQAAGLIHPNLRAVLLGRELLKVQGRRVRVAIGTPLPVDQLDRFADPKDLIEFLRLRTFVLRSRLEREKFEESPRLHSIVRSIPARSRTPEPVRMEPVATAPAHSPSDLAAEILALPPERILVKRGDQRVIYAESDQIPRVLQEVGRLRELSFREVGEGTGQAEDLDRYDQTYLHLVLWDEKSGGVIGSCRLGRTDRLIETQGIDGLYTRTLFRYDEALIHELGPSLEMGRSFIHPDHQRRVEPLMLLWKGIARYSGKFPKYRRLFGPVSISADYHATSTRLLLSFLDATERISRLERLVKPRNPFPFTPPRDWDPTSLRAVRSLDDIDELVLEIERGERSVPVLVRQYLKLNAVFLGFNVDPDFCNVVDGLVLVDLLRMNRRLLRFYMGEELVGPFLKIHAEADSRRQAEPASQPIF